MLSNIPLFGLERILFDDIFHCYQVRPHFLCASLMSPLRTKKSNPQIDSQIPHHFTGVNNAVWIVSGLKRILSIVIKDTFNNDRNVYDTSPDVSFF